MRKPLMLLATIATLGLWSCGAMKEEKLPDTQAQNAEPQVVVVHDTVYIERPDTTTNLQAEEVAAIKQDNMLDANTYYVIGGSFKKMKHATELDTRLKAKGYQSQILKPYKTFNRVAIRAYTDEANARKELDKLRKDFNDVSFWLLVP